MSNTSSNCNVCGCPMSYRHVSCINCTWWGYWYLQYYKAQTSPSVSRLRLTGINDKIDSCVQRAKVA